MNDVLTISLSQKQLDDAWVVEKDGNFLVVRGAKIEKFAARTDFENVHSINRLRDIMKKMGITHELQRQGAKADAIIQIGEHELTLSELQ
jgi:GTP-binding protein